MRRSPSRIRANQTPWRMALSHVKQCSGKIPSSEASKFFISPPVLPQAMFLWLCQTSSQPICTISRSQADSHSFVPPLLLTCPEGVLRDASVLTLFHPNTRDSVDKRPGQKSRGKNAKQESRGRRGLLRSSES